MAEFSRQGAILRPLHPPQPILLFVDETLFPDTTAFVQTALPFIRNVYEEHLRPKAAELLRKLGKDAKEFKGGKICKGNAHIYKDFFERIMLVLGAQAKKSDMRPIVSVNASDVYEGKNSELAYNVICKKLLQVGISNIPQATSEFAKQLLWLHNHFPQIRPRQVPNSFDLIFDEKHSYAKELRDLRVIRRIDGSVVFLEFGEILTSCANMLFRRVLRPTIEPVRVRHFQFESSRDSFGIQAADILTHLVYIALMHNKGLKTKNSALKVSLLREFFPDGIGCNILDDAIQVRDGKITCVKPGFRLTMQINPAV